MKKIHHFLYTSHFILETDQKPLEAILSKSINQGTLRLWRILIRTFPYHFTVWYIPGLTNQLADYLYQLVGQKNTIKLPKCYAYQITNHLCARNDSLQQNRIPTQEDDELAFFRHTITQGWPSTIKDDEYIGESARNFEERYKEHLKVPSPYMTTLTSLVMMSPLTTLPYWRERTKTS